MKRLLKTVTAGTGLTFQDKVVFSPSDLITILGEIEELQKCNVGFKSGDNGVLVLIVGDNEYEITDKAQMVFV